MIKLNRWFSRQKLNMKFTLMIGMIIFIPVLGIFTLLFQNLKENNTKQAENNLKYVMSQSYGVIQKTVELCNTSTQVFLNYQNLIDFLLKLEEGVSLETLDLVGFYQNDIGMLENIVNSNPYLYQIRVYSSTDNFPEMMPILYRHQRLMELEWSKGYVSGEWQFNYNDQMFSNSVNSSDHTMGLITTIEDFEYGEIAVIEVAVRMDEVFSNLFQSTDQEWTCFVDENGIIYSGSEENSIFEEERETNVKAILENWNQEEEKYFETTLSGKPVMVGVFPVKELSGTMIQVMNMENNLRDLLKIQLVYMAFLIPIFICLILLINITVKVLLKRFYYILATITQIQEGDLDARINRSGSDEMGQLGLQIDKMLDTIDRLMHENLSRELLMKNSEIKALQNQINAHFIYNVLESIKMMAEIDEKYMISDAVTSLGKLLRYGMKFTSKNVTVEQEIEYIRNYLELINLRFDYRINLALNIPKNLYHQEIPKISLQPIVENAIYHGIEELAEDASIYIKAYEESQDFYIEITDSGKGMSIEEIQDLQKKIDGEIEAGGGSGNGIGLKNVQDRIRISFGEQYGISLYSKEMCYTKVVVKLPITHKEEKV